MKYLKMVLAFALFLTMAMSANAATNKYTDEFTSEDSTGHWTFTSTTTGKSLENVEIITATPATLTTATSGRTYIIAQDSNAVPINTVVSITLPPASGTTAKVCYKFVTDGSGLVIRTADGARDNIFMWGMDKDTAHLPAAQVQMRVAQSNSVNPTTGTSIEVRMGSNVWYVTAASPTSIDMETVTDLW